jgi:hypothetical protein
LELNDKLTVVPENFSLDAVRELFTTYGAVFLPRFLPEHDISLVTSHISELVRIQLELVSPAATRPSDYNYLVDGILELAARDRNKVGSVYDAAMKMLSVRALGLTEPVQELVRHVLSSNLLAMSNNIIVRIDLKGEEERLFGWHQDYPYSMVSQHGAVVWTPLTPVTADVGPVQVLPYSHRNGIRKLTIDHRRHLNIRDDEYIDSLPPPVAFECVPGDVVLFNVLSLHRSSPNVSAIPRWSVTFRYCDMTDEHSLQRGWPTFYTQGRHFKDVYPELITEK